MVSLIQREKLKIVFLHKGDHNRPQKVAVKQVLVATPILI